MSAPEGGGDTERVAQRIDKWLWHARITKTRGLAQKLLTGGNVRINRDKVRSASRLVRNGDVLTVTLGPRVWVLRIKGFADRRQGPLGASGLYDDLSAPSPDAAGSASALK